MEHDKATGDRGERGRDDRLRHARHAEDSSCRKVEGGSKARRLATDQSRPIGRLRFSLEFRKLNHTVDETELWCTLMRELVAVGRDAVPQLCAELDRTTENRMLRRLGFALRAIGDPRAVPALIRAIPRTLLPSQQRLRIDRRRWLRSRSSCRNTICGTDNSADSTSISEDPSARSRRASETDRAELRRLRAVRTQPQR